jgi:serine/threonine protein kinase
MAYPTRFSSVPTPGINNEHSLSIYSFIQVYVLYIQMEYCEGNTLRNVINEDLYKNKERIWRLFREILKGLGYIHSQVSFIGRPL